MEPEETKVNISQEDALKNLPKENLTLLFDTIEAINSTIEFKTLLIESMEAIRLVMKSEASSLMLIDEGTGELFVSMPTGPVKEDVKGKTIPKNKGIGGWVVENKTPYISNDVNSSEIFWGDLAKKFKTRNVICVPLINRSNEIIGVLQAVNRRKNGEFTPHDIPVFQALASHITVAIDRARKIDKLHSHIHHQDSMIVEIHHRIKNNLQIVSALLENELPSIKDNHAKEVMSSMFLRIRSMARLHDLLCQRNLSNEVDLGAYLTQLSDKIEETINNMNVEASIHLKTKKINIKSERALLCGLILNELLLNSYKHAFTDNAEKGNINIELSSENDQILLRVSDDGTGLPDEFDISKKESIGLWIVDVMLKKLEGEVIVHRNDGTRFEIRFPKE